MALSSHTHCNAYFDHGDAMERSPVLAKGHSHIQTTKKRTCGLLSMCPVYPWKSAFIDWLNLAVGNMGFPFGRASERRIGMDHKIIFGPRNGLFSHDGVFRSATR